MKLTKENKDYIRRRAKALGITQQDLINKILDVKRRQTELNKMRSGK